MLNGSVSSLNKAFLLPSLAEALEGNAESLGKTVRIWSYISPHGWDSRPHSSPAPCLNEHWAQTMKWFLSFSCAFQATSCREGCLQSELKMLGELLTKPYSFWQGVRGESGERGYQGEPGHPGSQVVSVNLFLGLKDICLKFQLRFFDRDLTYIRVTLATSFPGPPKANYITLFWAG